MESCISENKKIRGNLAYQQRQKQRQNYLEKKRALRRTFELGKLLKKAGFENEELTVIYRLLLETKEKLLCEKAETIRQDLQINES